MSIARLNTIVTSGVLPFNFGTTVAEWQQIYETVPSMRAAIGDPATWSPAERALIDQTAAEEIALYDRLMGLSADEFRAEIERLTKETTT
jgi:hypothetical protein